MNSILKLILTLAALALSLLLCAILYVGWPREVTEVEVGSPHGRYVAKVVSSSGGGAAGSVLVYVRVTDLQSRTGWPISSSATADVALLSHSSKVRLSWESETNLVVEYPSYDGRYFMERLEEWKSVRIAFREANKPPVQ